jgi:probable F420-dependent oxidoreductase
MTPFFDPGPNPHGAPTVLLAGVGEAMTAVAGEVADGFLCHGFTTERYLREVTRPALARGRGGDLAGFEVSGSPLVATGRTEEEMEAACRGVREQIAFYGSTPAYRGVLELHGWGALFEELHALSLQGRWQHGRRHRRRDPADVRGGGRAVRRARRAAATLWRPVHAHVALRAVHHRS